MGKGYMAFIGFSLKIEDISILKFYFICIHAVPLKARREGVKSPGAGVTDCCEFPCRCWELSLPPLEDHLVLLTTEPSH